MTEKLAYRLADAASAIGVSKRTIERMIDNGKLEARQSNGIRLIPAEALHGYLSSLPRVPPRKAAQS